MGDGTGTKKPAFSAEIDALCKNYEEMNETGKRKLKEVAEKILDIWNTVNKDDDGSSLLRDKSLTY
jgi:hypothetical protein